VTTSPRKLGKFRIPYDTPRNWEKLLPLMAKMVIVRAEALFATDQIEYTAFSHMFEELSDGEMPPFYEISEDLSTAKKL
jgi:hypothetical protein